MQSEIPKALVDPSDKVKPENKMLKFLKRTFSVRVVERKRYEELERLEKHVKLIKNKRLKNKVDKCIFSKVGEALKHK